MITAKSKLFTNLVENAEASRTGCTADTITVKASNGQRYKIKAYGKSKTGLQVYIAICKSKTTGVYPSCSPVAFVGDVAFIGDKWGIKAQHVLDGQAIETIENGVPTWRNVG